MRHVATLLSLGALTLVAGCSSTRWSFVKNADRQPASAAPGELPSTAQLVHYLNDNAGRIQSLRVDDLDMTCRQGIKSFGLRGTMVTEKAHNFRLGANALGNQVVDLGSNDHEFWYWISKAEPPYQFYCSYKDLKEFKGRMPIPFQPEWVMEALGLGPYGPPEKYTLEHDTQTLKLVEKTTSPQGTPVRKVIVFKRSRVEPPKPQVTDYLLLDDASGKEICAAHISEVQMDRGGTYAVVPKRIELRWRAENLRLDLHLDAAKFNIQTAPETFTRQTSRNIQSFNLGRMQVDNSPPPQALSGAIPRPQALLDSKIQPVQNVVP